MTGKYRFRAKKVAAKPTVAILEKQIKKLQREDKPEVKVYEISGQLVPISNAGAITSICGIAQGTTYNQRVGDQLKAVHLDMRYIIYPDVAAAVQANYNACAFRVIVFVDKRSPAAGYTPSMAEVLETTAAPAVVISPMEQSADQTKRFHILYDKTHYMEPQTGRGTVVHKKLSLKNLAIDYQASASATWLKNPIYYMFVSDLAADDPLISYDFRLYFTDA